jgi:hypothetical protein
MPDGASASKHVRVRMEPAFPAIPRLITCQTSVPFGTASLGFIIPFSIKSDVDFCSTFRNRVMTVRTAYAGWMRRPEEVAKMNPSEMETGREISVRCESCDRSKDDVFILPDGSVVCVDCAELWERDRAKHN